MAVRSPVPAATMRKGSVAEPPSVMTRTGVICLIPWPGWSRRAMKPNPSCAYAAMTGAMSGGTT
jgi:hypothetical protein